jgi:uncharacterized protein involved in exopolysaccharide biosynthesis
LTLKNQSQNIEESSPSSDAEVSAKIDWMNILSILWHSRKFIGIVAGVVTVLAILISLLLPESFKSTAILLPDTDKSKLGSLGGMSDLAALAGVSVGGEVSLVKLYPTIIKSESVLKNVIYSRYQTKAYPDSVNLIQFWEIKEKNSEQDYEVALLNLRTGLDITMDLKTAVLTMSIETEEPQLSADILNNTIRAVEKFIRTKRNTNASEQRKWIEARLVEVKADLSKAENALKDFREKNRSISGSPQLLLDQERLMREMQINSTMYVELKKQYELAKIEEIRTTPIINVLDYGHAAAKKERPKRAIIVMSWFFLSLVGSASYRIVMWMYRNKIITWFKKLKVPITANGKEI